MKVLVIPEDQALDQYIVQPVVEAMFDDLEIPARITVLPEPRLRGASDALNADLLKEIITDNPMEDLFLLIVDRDCDREQNVSKAAAREAEHPGKLLACVAVQEIEVWLLALYSSEAGINYFTEAREECDPKEKWAEPLLEKLGSQGPGKGRKAAMRALAGKWRSLRDRCPELKDLQEQIRQWRDAR